MTLLLLICCHYLCDFPLQGEFVSKYKAKYINGNYNPIWYHVLIAHSVIHTLPVLLITGSWGLGLWMIVSHFAIDYLKCAKVITFNQDQFLHGLVILSIWALTII